MIVNADTASGPSSGCPAARHPLRAAGQAAQV